MNWPNNGAYTEAVRNYPDISIQDPKLKGGSPRQGRDGFLVSYAGGFSIVFPIDKGSNAFALRCWTQEVRDAETRYKEISDYLKHVRLPYFVDFEYVPQGILIDGTQYPITRMEWAEGVSLRDFISQNLRHPHRFTVAADVFQKMVATLHKHQISHGDLQDGNILLKRNGKNVEMKLIDYDSLFVPALHGQPDSIVGLPEYQHPERLAAGGQARTNEKVDYFSELVIYLSFSVLSEKPVLWNKFKDKTERGLLFSEQDFVNPNQSPVFRELANLSPDVQQLAATLKDFCTTSIDQLEPLETILPQSDANTHTNRGIFFLNNKHYDEAQAEFQRALTLDSKYGEAHRGIGLVHLHTQQYADAINAFQQAIKFKPNYEEAHYGLGVTYFESGESSKATAAVNAALGIDPHYQPARQLLAIITSATSSPISPSPTKPKPPPDPTPGPLAPLWQHITGVVKRNRHSVTTGTLGLVLVVCFIAFLTQMDAKDTTFSQNTELTKQLREKKKEVHRQGLEIQGLTSSVQTLKSTNQKLSRDNSELQKKLDDRIFTTNTKFRDVVNLRRQLNEQKDTNRKLESQLTKKNTEIRQLRNDRDVALNENQKLKKQLIGNNHGNADQATTIQRLRKEKTEASTRNRRLQEQLVGKTSEANNLTEQAQQLQSEKTETQRHNQKLQGENAELARQNRNLRHENEVLRNQLGKTKGQNFSGILDPEPPKKTQYYRNVVPRAVSHNNQGCLDFERGRYNEAVKQFEQAVRADSRFAVAQYNLGCVYLKMKAYKKAIKVFSEAVAINYRFKEAYYNLGLAHLGNGDREAAQSSAELALKTSRNYQSVHKLLAVIAKAQQ